LRLPTIASVVLFSLLLGACGTERSQTSSAGAIDTGVVHCVNYPLAYFAERLAGDEATIRFDAPPDGDPAFWKPNDEQVAAFQRAELILRNGAKYAKWMRTVSLPASRMADTSNSFHKRLITVTGGVTHSHGPGGKHDHGALAFTTWLDFAQAAEQADNVANALTARGLAASDGLAAARAALRSDLEALDSAMQALGKRWGSKPLRASHPVYQYLGRRYGLEILSEHFEPDALPTAKQLARLASAQKKTPAAWMLWEAQPLPETEKRLLALGIRCVVFDPCGNRPASGDFLDVMRANVKRLEKALSQ
jgi:zinc transport system substrate-binding protein